MQRREFVRNLCAAGGVLATQSFSLRALPLRQAPATEVKRVLVIFKCHFDCGFIDTQAHVVAKYFQQYFPRAIQTAASQRQAGNDAYVWTTGSWLLYEYLEQATPEQRKRMEQAIADGDIAWHALPFSWQTELMDPSMIAGSLGLSQSLDRRFGYITTGCKMTDVPGHTRGLISPLAEHGIRFLDIGANDGSPPAAVPPLFIWRDTHGSELIVYYHHGYGGVVQVPGSDLAVAIVVRGDNSGPHTIGEIHQIYTDLRKQFPDATVIATDLTKIANAVIPYRSQLPVITQEIGDTWIYGAASDPLKVVRYREIARLRQEWIRQGKFRTADATDVALLRSLLLEVEHTWGTDTKTWLDFDHYTPKDLAAMLDTKNYKVVQFSWEEKRKDLFDAIATLPASLRTQANGCIQALSSNWPEGTPPEPVQAENEIETKHFVTSIDRATGAIIRLHSKKTGREWASPNHPLGLFSYQTLSKNDYDSFIKSYVTTDESWAFKDFGKPNIDHFGARSSVWLPTLKGFQHTHTTTGDLLLSQLEIVDSDSLQSGRVAWPHKMYLEILLLDAQPTIEINFSWYGKPANRLPEALWLTFQPYGTTTQGWALDKLGQSVSPTDIVPGGNRHMHAVSTGLTYKDSKDSLIITTLDAPVVALDVKSPIYFSNDQPDLSNGIHFSLFNNGWGTNYIMWFAEDMRFRFRLQTT